MIAGIELMHRIRKGRFGLDRRAVQPPILGDRRLSLAFPCPSRPPKV
jgi:hypothetical protein